ncbi:MAG: TIGR04255 family protein [Candidatus Hydrogenedentota bacterium]
MTESHHKLGNPPIVEAVVDIDCDLPPGVELEGLKEKAQACFRAEYPDFQTRYMFEHEFQKKGEAELRASSRRGVEGYLFRHENRKQLVQVRRQGFSFNRLAPYSTLDDYLPEIERTWRQFVEFAKPVQVRVIRLRYVNRLPLPLTEGTVDLDAYLRVGPRLPDEERLTFSGFLNQHKAVERETGNEVRTVLTSRKPESGALPVIFDITASKAVDMEPDDWAMISSTIQSLRDLKNRVFYHTLTEQCLKLFQ